MKHSSSWGKRALAALGVAALALPVAVGTATAVTPSLPGAGNGSLTIHKYATPSGVTASEAARTGTTADATSVPSGATALQGAVFAIQPICYKTKPIDLTTTAGWEQASKVTSANAITGDYALCGSESTQTTAANGEAVFPSLTKTIYKVWEKSAPTTVTKLADPFIVTIPLGKADGTWIDNVHVYPKNSTADAPKKTLDAASSVLGSVASDADKAVWTLTATVPALKDGATKYTKIEFVDTLDAALGTVASGDFAVSMTKNGASFTDFDRSESSGSTVKVKLTEAGLGAVKAGDVLVVTLTTDFIANGSVENSFTFNSGDDKGDNPGTDSDGTTTPTVNYGTFKLIKKDASTDERLNGVQFKICEANSDTQPTACKDTNYLNTGSTAPNATGTTLTTAGDDTSAGEVTATVKISAGAKNASPALATSKGICVVETGPLDGYIVNDDNRTTCFTVSTTHTTNAPLEQTITNVKNTAWNANLPVTGAQGLVLLVLGGGALVAIALGSALVIRRRQA